METDLKEAVVKSKKAMKSLENKVEELAHDFSEHTNEVWGDFKKSFSKV